LPFVFLHLPNCFLLVCELSEQHAARPHTKPHNHVRPDAMAPYFVQHDEALSTIQRAESSIAGCLVLDGVAEERVHQVGP
jgi:hypothetical protein